jgi:hypothetical protein
MVGCTKCGKNIPGLCRWCPGCGEEVWPLLLSNQPDGPNEVGCPNCGKFNFSASVKCRYCGAPLKASQPTIGENQSQGQGGRISLNPDDLGNSTPPAAGPQAGGRLSRLAQARNKYDAEKKGSGDSGDWLNSLRPDGAATSGKNLAPAPPPPVGTPSQDNVPPPTTQAADFNAAPATPTGQANLAGAGSAPAGNLGFPTIPTPSEEPDAIPGPPDNEATQVNPAIGELKDDSTLPEWLKELGDEAPPKAAKIKPRTPTSLNTGDLGLSRENIPQWLRDFAAESTPFSAAPEDEPAPAKQVSSTGPVAPKPEPADDDESDLPEWLRSTNEEIAPEDDTPKRDILDWLKGPNHTDTTPPAPTFGDVDVEERLNFAFDEPQSGNPDEAGRPHSGLTSILGFSPYAPNEIMGATPPANSGPDSVERPPTENPRNFPQQTVFLDDLASLEEAPPVTPAPAPPPASAENPRNLPQHTVFLDDLAMVDEAPPSPAAPSSPPVTPDPRNLPQHTVFLDELADLEEAPPVTPAPAPSDAENPRNLPQYTVFLNDLAELDEAPELNPPVEENSRTEHTVFLGDLASLDEAPPSPPAAGAGLRPWLAGLEPPTLETPASPPSQSAGGEPSPDLKPWLAGLQPPALEAGSLSAGVETAISEIPSDYDGFTPDYIQNVRSKGTRPFSVGAMLSQPGLISDEVAANPDATVESAQPGLESLSSGAKTSETAAGEDVASKMKSFSPGNDLTGQELPDKEALSALLATLPDLPELSLEDASSASTPPAKPQSGPRSDRFSFGYLDNETGELESGNLSGAASGEPPRPGASEPGKPSTFELPEFLANPGADSLGEEEPPTWQRLFVPETSPETAEPATRPGEDTTGAQPTERPGVIAPVTPTGSSSPASSTEPDQEDSWAAQWGSDNATSDPAASLPDLPPLPTIPPAVSPAEPESQEDPNDIPDWLRALSASGPVEAAPPPVVSGYTELNGGSSAPAETALPDEELPDWLQDEPDQPATPAIIAPAAPTKPLQPKGPTGEERQLPDWLKEPSEEPEFDPTLPPLSSGQSPAQLPDWLKEPEAPALTFGPEDYTGPTMPRERQEGPPVDYTALLQEVPGEQLSGNNFFGDVEGPAWLQQSNAPKPSEPAPDSAATPAPSENALPAWLRSVAPPPNAAPEQETARVILPATKDEAEEVPAAPPAEPPESEGEPEPEPAEDEVPSVNLPPRLASAAVLETLLLPNAAPVEEVSSKSKRGFRLSPNFVRFFLYILLLAVAIFGLLRPLPLGSLSISPNVQAFYSQIDGLPANAKVLVAFDWDADRSGEMNPLSTAVVQHLMAKRARLVTLSLNPQGPALAARVTDELATNPIYGNNSFYKYGTTYLNLGWRSGQEAALRSLFSSMGDLTDYKNGQRAGDLAATAGINSLTDFDLIVVLAGDEGSVRTWVEQVGVQPGAHMVLGVPQAVEPVARPYAQGLTTANPGQMSGETQPRAQALLAGLNQTAQYDQLLQDKLNLKTDPTVGVEGRMTAQSLAAILLIVVIVVVNVIYLVRRRR